MMFSLCFRNVMNLRKYYFLLATILGLLLLSSCFYDCALSQPTAQIDTFLLGSWMTQDKSGKFFQATLSPLDSTHYRVLFSSKDELHTPVWEFVGWISRIGNVKFLTLRSLSCQKAYHDRYLFLHYELITPEKDPADGGIGARRVRLREPQLPSFALHLDSYHLRQLIRKELREGKLLSPSNSSEGCSIWIQTEKTAVWPKHL